MLEIISAESGGPVARWGGLTLASTRQPERDAHKWVDQVASQVESVEHVIVLGLGCGYHVFALRERFPQKSIYVLEACRELIQFCEKNFSLQMAKLEVILLESTSQMTTSARVQKAVSHSYAVIEHKPSQQTSRPFYREVAAALRGRERAAFRDYLELRPGRKSLFDEKKVVGEVLSDEHSNQLLSIKDVEMWLKPEERWSRAGCFIQALRELLK